MPAATSAAEAGRAAPPWLGRGAAAATPDSPPLDEAMARSAAAWATSFAALASTPCDIVGAGTALSRVDLVAARRPGSIFAALHAAGWSSPAALQFDRRFIALMVEALFGGEGDDDDLAPTAPLSALELRIADVLAAQVTEALAAGFAGPLAAGFLYERLLPKPDLAFLGKPGASVIAATLAVTTLGRSVCCDLLIPAQVLAARTAAMPALPNDDEPVPDGRWSRQLEAEIARTAMRLDAVLDGPALSLGAVAALRPGQVLALPVGAGGRVTLSCAETPLFRCDLGQSDGFYTLRVQDTLATPAAPAEWTPSSAPNQDRPASP